MLEGTEESSRESSRQSSAHAELTPGAMTTAPRRGGRRAGRRRAIGYLLAGLALWLAGRGLGWFGTGPSEPQQSASANEPATRSFTTTESGSIATKQLATAGSAAEYVPMLATAGEVPASRTLQGVPALVQTPAAAPDSAQQVAVATTTSGAAVANDPALPAGMAEDRFESLLSLLELHLSESALGSASAALQRLQDQPLSVAQEGRLATVQARLLPLQQEFEQRILEHVRQGEVLAADQLAASLVVGGVWPAERLLAAVPDLALGDDWQRALATERTSLPKPALLQRNRAVRIRFRDQLHAGIVANSSEDQVTVRLRSATGQSFPTVKVIACEPADSTAMDAIEMGIAAARAGVPRLARLWLLRSHLVDAQLPPRGLQLLELLR